MCRLTKLIPGLEIQKVNEIKQVVHFFVMVDAKGRGGASPLHIACSRDTGYIFNSPLATINLLLEYLWTQETMMGTLLCTGQHARSQ